VEIIFIGEKRMCPNKHFLFAAKTRKTALLRLKMPEAGHFMHSPKKTGIGQ